jgi:SAM-dependent methyltransferase
MRQGDFTALAKAYAHRPAYSPTVLDTLARLITSEVGRPRVADIGAGTGKLTTMLEGLGFQGFAVEPNAAMRHEGEALGLPNFSWSGGRAEATGLADGAVDWVTMASAFHWTDAPAALAEFHRILRPGGRLTLMWNPRDVARDPLQTEIEARIAKIAPDLRRKSSGAAAYTEALEDTLLEGGLFTDLIFMEAPHVESMSRARHLGAWRSVNDIQAQAGPQRWAEILSAIETLLADREAVEVRYRTRAWTVRKT